MSEIEKKMKFFRLIKTIESAWKVSQCVKETALLTADWLRSDAKLIGQFFVYKNLEEKKRV